MKNPISIILSGAIESKELSEAQKKVIYVLAYCGKIAMTASATTILSTVRKPDGLQLVQEKLKKDNKSMHALKPEEWEEYEKLLFEKVEEPLGGTQHFLNFLLLEIRSNKKFQDMIEKMSEEATKLADESLSNDFLTQSDDSRLT